MWWIGYHQLSLEGQLCLINIFSGEVLKFIPDSLDNSKPLFPFPHIYVGHPLKKACVSFGWDHYPLGWCDNPLLVDGLLNVVPLFLKASYR